MDFLNKFECNFRFDIAATAQSLHDNVQTKIIIIFTKVLFFTACSVFFVQTMFCLLNYSISNSQEMLISFRDRLLFGFEIQNLGGQNRTLNLSIGASVFLC